MPDKNIDTKDIDHLESLCERYWNDMRIPPPNANQLGVAIAAALDVKSKSHQK